MPPPVQAASLETLGASARGRLRMAGAAAVLAGCLLVPQAAAIAWLVQRCLVERVPVDQAGAVFLVLLAVGLARAGLSCWSRRCSDEAVERIRDTLRRTLSRRLLAQGPLWLRQRRSGALAELMGTHADAMEGYFGGYRLARTEVTVVPAVLLVAAFAIDRSVGVILLATLPLIPVFMMLVGWGAQAASRQQLQALSRMGAHFADRLRGLGLIRLYGRGGAELQGLREAAEGLRVRSMKVLRIAFLSSAVLEFFASLGVAMVAVYLGLSYLGMIDLRATPLTLGMGVFCLLLAPEVYAPLRRLATHYHDRANALAAWQEIETAFEAGTPAIAGTASAGAAPEQLLRADSVQAHAIALRPLGAASDVLRDLSFQLPLGGRLALVGASGGGKSTLLDALAGWLPVNAGALCLPPGLRIGYAPQRPHLFQASIADNLRLANPTASDETLHAAAEAAQVMAFARALPRGLDTLIGERGFGLSGGQARRIALARVFLRDPDLVLLDEPTAFLDPRTEADLLDALALFCRQRTLVIATHSAAALRLADLVLSLPEGRLSKAQARR